MTFQLPDANGPLCLAVEMNTQQVAHRMVLPKLEPEPFDGTNLFYTEESQHYITGHMNINHFATEGNNAMSLLLLETFFFCKCVPREASITVVYVGAYPGDHIKHISAMFPNIKFRLYDSRFGRESHKVLPTASIEVIAEEFSEDKAKRISEEFRGKLDSLFYISTIRGANYTKKGSSHQNSEIIDSDMWRQLHWAQIMKPAWSLIRYRPKLKSERPVPEGHVSDEEQLSEGYSASANVSQYLTDEFDSISKRQLYYNYPTGYFLRIPMSKKNQIGMFLMTCSGKTNGYKPTTRYYHDDMISLSEHHNQFIRRVSLFINPYTNTYDGIYGIERVKSYAREHSLEVVKPERYICGAGWDHRAMLYIMTLYMRYARRGNNDIIRIREEAIELILRIFITMEINHTEEQ